MSDETVVTAPTPEKVIPTTEENTAADASVDKKEEENTAETK